MIVPSMTIQEIHKELLGDVKSLADKFDNYCLKDFRKKVLRANRYPLSQSYDCITREKKNLFVVTYTAMKRSNRKDPIVHVYGIYTRPEGCYAVSLTLDMNMISIYPPHFFKRYRERIVKDEWISSNDIIRRYFRNDWGLVGAVVNQNFESVYHCFENDDKDDKVSFVAVSSEGYCFGEKQGNINIIKTIISEDMLFDDQKPLFADLKRLFIDANKERHGIDILQKRL